MKVSAHVIYTTSRLQIRINYIQGLEFPGGILFNIYGLQIYHDLSLCSIVLVLSKSLLLSGHQSTWVFLQGVIHNHWPANSHTSGESLFRPMQTCGLCRFVPTAFTAGTRKFTALTFLFHYCAHFSHVIHNLLRPQLWPNTSWIAMPLSRSPHVWKYVSCSRPLTLSISLTMVTLIDDYYHHPLGDYVLNYLAAHTSLEKFVQQSLITLLCRLTKAGWFDTADDGRGFRDILNCASKFIEVCSSWGSLLVCSRCGPKWMDFQMTRCRFGPTNYS